METFQIKGEYIQLNQLLKVLNWCEDGSHANYIIDEGLVKVNGQTEKEEEIKLYPEL